MSKRDTYEQFVAEINTAPFTTTDTTIFSNYTIRDAIMLTACSDEQFAQVLLMKISKTINEAKVIVQDDIEALTTAYHVSAMWEKPETEAFCVLTHSLTQKYNLERPPLADLTDRVIKLPVPKSTIRIDMVAGGLKNEVLADLDK